jgi:DNA invertase Pin-like site-specific DNA recombinase
MSKRVKTGDPKVAIAYVRASKDEQKLTAHAQRTSIEQWATREGVRVVGWFVDEGVSGSSSLERRPGLMAALDAVKARGAGVLVVLRRDRLARDTYVAVLIDRAALAKGARVQTADGTGNGDQAADAFMRHVLDGAAAYELAMIKARTTAALAHKKAKGERTGGMPYGFMTGGDGRTLEPNPTEQTVVALVRELHAAGVALRRIVLELAARGHVPRTGKDWHKTQIVRMLAAP